MLTYKKKVISKMLFASLATVLLLLLSVNQEVFSQPFLPGKLIFIDSFESGQLQDRWHMDNPDTTKINYNPLNVHFSSRSMEVIALPGKEAGGGKNFLYARL